MWALRLSRIRIFFIGFSIEERFLVKGFVSLRSSHSLRWWKGLDFNLYIEFMDHFHIIIFIKFLNDEENSKDYRK